MSSSERKSRTEFLLQFLTLPEASRLVENLRYFQKDFFLGSKRYACTCSSFEN